MKNLKRNKKKVKLQNVYNNRNREFQINDIRHPLNMNENMKPNKNAIMNEAVEKYGISPNQVLSDMRIIKGLKTLCESEEQFKVARNMYYDDMCVDAMEKGHDRAAEFYDLLINYFL
jgi:hypothetical protein